MRYFIGTKNSVAVGKHCLSGDDEKIDQIVAQLFKTDPTVDISEVDLEAFDSSSVISPTTQAQKDWDAFKSTNPTVDQTLSYFARSLGLE